MAVRGAVLRRLPRRHRRCLDSLVHRPARPLRHDDAARSVLGRARRFPRGHGDRRRGRPANGDRAAVADLECRHHGQRHQPRSLAKPPPCRAPELALLPERLRGPHRGACDGDRRFAAPERNRHRHRRLGHPDLQRQRIDPARHRQPVADAADPRLVRLLRPAAALLRSARPRPVEAQFRGAVAHRRADRRQLHQHPDAEAVRPPRARGCLCARGDRQPHRDFSPPASDALDLHHAPADAERGVVHDGVGPGDRPVGRREPSMSASSR